MTNEEMIIASVVSNIVALLLLFLSWRTKNIARVLFAILFIWASWTNWKTAHTNPGVYMEYGEYAIKPYQQIIYGEFANHVTGFVSFIAVAQLLMGLGLLARGLIVKAACLAGILFFIGIAPLGFGSAFPFSITASIALLLLYRYDFEKDIFKNKWWV